MKKTIIILSVAFALLLLVLCGLLFMTRTPAPPAAETPPATEQPTETTAPPTEATTAPTEPETEPEETTEPAEETTVPTEETTAPTEETTVPTTAPRPVAPAPEEDEEEEEEPETEAPKETTAPPTYTVTFQYNGATFATQTVTSGKTATLPKLQPTQSGSWTGIDKPITGNTTIVWTAAN